MLYYCQYVLKWVIEHINCLNKICESCNLEIEDWILNKLFIACTVTFRAFTCAITCWTFTSFTPRTGDFIISRIGISFPSTTCTFSIITVWTWTISWTIAVTAFNLMVPRIVRIVTLIAVLWILIIRLEYLFFIRVIFTTWIKCHTRNKKEY